MAPATPPHPRARSEAETARPHAAWLTHATWLINGGGGSGGGYGVVATPSLRVCEMRRGGLGEERARPPPELKQWTYSSSKSSRASPRAASTRASLSPS